MEAHQRSRLQRAMIELVATDGFEALTVRSLTKRARVSSGTFYSHFRGTDDCLLSSFDLLCQRAAERFLEGGQDEPEPQRRLALAIDRLLQDTAASPQAATFMLRAAPAAGPAFTGRLRNSTMRLGVALELCLRSGDGPQLPPLLLEGIVAGLLQAGRVYLAADGEEETGGVAAEVADWIVSLSLSAQDAGLLRAAVSPERNGRTPAPGPQDWSWGEVPGDERAMISAAAFRIAKEGGYHQLTIPRICREAGIPRRRFDRHFSGTDDCFVSALEAQVTTVLAALPSNQPRARWSAAVYRKLGALCGAIEADPDSARVVLVETSAAGTAGIDSHDRQISQIAQVLRGGAPEAQKPTHVAAEASTAAALAILRRRASEKSSAATAHLLPLLALLALAPAIGAPAVLRAMGHERAGREN